MPVSRTTIMKTQDILEKENEEAARVQIGGVVLVSIMMFIGVLGNAHVLVAYAFRVKSSNRRTFILVLGTLDFITCVVGMPFIITDLRKPMTFHNTAVCKLLRFYNYFICTSSSSVLLIIAIDRYVHAVLCIFFFSCILSYKNG